MRLYAAGNKILLDPEPLTAKEVGRNARFKAQFKRHVMCELDGMFLLNEIGNFTEFDKIVSSLSRLASRLNVDLTIDEDLEKSFVRVRELAGTLTPGQRNQAWRP